MLAPLDNGVIFAKAFSEPRVLEPFVRDIFGIDFKAGKIETEKSFSPPVGQIDVRYDIFAESEDHRCVVEMQRVDYDYHFHRFLLYHNTAIAQMQTKGPDYLVRRKVYTVVVLTSPYKLHEVDGLPIKDSVLISSADPRNLEGKVREVFGHTLVFLNPSFPLDDVPANYRDWLTLFSTSINAPDEVERVNRDHVGIRLATELITMEKLTPEERRLMMIDNGRKAMAEMLRLQAEAAEARAVAEHARAEGEKARAVAEHARAEGEKVRAAEADARAEGEKVRAEGEKVRAERLLAQLRAAGIEPAE